MILIPFSSGLDSTTLVYKALKAEKQFRLVYFKINNNPKAEIEIAQAKKILSLLQEEFPRANNLQLDTIISIDVVDFNKWNSPLAFTQLPIWMVGLLFSLDYKVTEIQLGYCMNDDMISYIPELKKLWNSYKLFLHDFKPNLSFPLVKWQKRNSANLLPNNIFQETYFCESPNIKEQSWDDCGCCDSCKRYKYIGLFTNYKRNQKSLEELPPTEFKKPRKIVTELTPTLYKSPYQLELQFEDDKIENYEFEIMAEEDTSFVSH